MTLIREKLEIGEHMGEVPPETPAVPLQRDLEARQRRLRLPADRPITRTTTSTCATRPTARAASCCTRLRLLGIHWGEQQHAGE